MAWLELHQTLPQNKKTLRLMSLLRIDTPQAVGHLCMLWLWAIDNAPEGDLKPFLDGEIAYIAGWKKKPSDFVEALMASGFLNAEKEIHDWCNYAGKLIDKRKSDAERKKQTRQMSNGHPTDIQRTSNGSPTEVAGNSTVPYSTVHKDLKDSTYAREKSVEIDDDENPEKAPSKTEEAFNQFWEAYPRKIGKKAAQTAFIAAKIKAGQLPQIIQAVNASKISEQWHREQGRYIPNPATWINQGRWLDEPAEMASPGSFKTDEFFELAKMRTYGKNGEGNTG